MDRKFSKLVILPVALAVPALTLMIPQGSEPTNTLYAQTGNQSPKTQNQVVKPAEPPQTGKWDKFVKPDKKALKKQLASLQYRVTQDDDTEPAFKNEYWNHKEAGIYVDIVSGEPLFSSLDKYDSRTGWPSFTRPLESEYIVKKVDKSYGMTRTEVRSKRGDSHLGHLFNDGPKPTGLRYCINSASLRFIPVSKLEVEGYGKYLKLFDKTGS